MRKATLTQTTRRKKKQNKNIGAQFFDFLTAHTKQITILIGRLKSILFYMKTKKKTFAKANKKKRSDNSIGIKRVVQKNNINKHILNSPYKTTSKAVKYISFFLHKNQKI